MKVPSDVRFYEDINLIVCRPRGLMNEASVNKILSVLAELEVTRKEPFDRFFDTLLHDNVELNFRYMIHISLYRRLTYMGRPPVKSAILATDSTITHYARLHALLTQGSPIDVRIFQDREQVADWLGVPVHLLTQDTTESNESQ